MRIFIKIMLLLGLGLPAPIQALQSDPFAQPHHNVTMRLTTDYDNLPEDGELPAAIVFNLGKEWKIYWRNPGQTGLPPQFDFSDSDNLKYAEILWPAPQRLNILGITANGYSRQVAFPVILTAENNQKPLNLKLTSRFLACAHVCIPLAASRTLSIPPSTGTPQQDIQASQTRTQFLNQIPQVLNHNRLAIAYDHSDDRYHYYRLTLNRDHNDAIIDIFAEQNNVSQNTSAIAPHITEQTADNPIKAQIITSATAPIADTLRITVTERNTKGALLKAWETPIPIAETQSPIAKATLTAENGMFASVPGLYQARIMLILFSLIGGLILNIMPCVLPALALKAFAMAHSPKADLEAIRTSFVTTATGIVSGFMLIGGALLTAKALGAEIGWGMQFQQPAFLSFMFLFMLLFSANLLGLFTIRTPTKIMQKITPLLNREQPQWVQDFLLGLFATLLATPCSAPFLGTAVAVALIVGGAETIIVFFFLGVGMALPYLAIAAYPKAAQYIPKPGAWMQILKIILALLLFATAAWLLWLLGLSLSWPVTLIIAALGITAVLYLYLRHKNIAHFKSHSAILPTLLIFAALLLSINPNAHTPTVKAAPFAHPSKINWNTFNETLISTAVEQGKTVFVDVTADWCVTCKFNKFNVLRKNTITAKLNSEHVLALRADWTHPNDNITRYLQKYNRAGVPFNIIYGPAAPQGIVLPEILTQTDILQALAMAEGRL